MNKSVSADVSQILYSKEVEEYLQSFQPLSADEVMEKIKTIWQKEGFINPTELTSKIYKLQLTENNPFLKKKKEMVINNIIEAGSPKDKLTGFDAKPKTPLLTGLAHLYGRETGIPVAIVEGDFSNMGGTNNKYREEMGGSRAFDGFAECDLAARVTARISLEQMQELAASKNAEYKANGQKPLCGVHAVRSGGDEIRIIVTGISVADVDSFVNSSIHPKIEDFTAKAGLHDHPHTKDPNNPYKTGFGLAFAVDDLSNPNLDPLTIIETLDKRIKLAKLDMGYKRKGKVAPDIEKAVRTELQSQGIAADKIEKAVKLMKADALKTSARYQQFKQGVEPLKFIHQTRDDKEGQTEFGHLANVNSTENNLFFKRIKTERNLFEDPNTTKKRQISSYISMIGSNPNDADINIAVRALDATKDIDPPTQLATSQTLYDGVDMFIADSEALKQTFTQKGIDIGNGTAKAVHLELGNLAGINEISHQHADVVLKDFADITKKTSQELGLGEYNFALYHEGGGKVKMLLPPVITSDNGNQTITVDSKLLETLSEKIISDIQKDINQKPLYDYFTEKGLAVNDNQGKPLKLGNGELIYDEANGKRATFADIPHPKRPWEKGITVTAVSADLQPNVNGETQIKDLSLKAEAIIFNKRENNRRNQEKQTSAMKGALICKVIAKER